MLLALNCGSSSVKFQLYDAEGAATDVGGWLAAGAVEELPDGLTPTVVAHRVVHGGAGLRAATVIDDAVLATIATLTPLAPTHQPAALAGIAMARQRWPSAVQVAVFDTAFHADLPPAAATYALDAALAARHGIRRYGFHGISCRYVTERAAALLGRPVADLNTIVLHLGSGASATAVAGGRSVDTSMGLTPLEGLVMATRAGDLDPGALLWLRQAGLSDAQLDAAVRTEGGLLGMCGDADMRAALARRDAGDPAAALALDVYCHRLRKYVGAYHAVLGRLDAIVFTAGVGENSAAVRSQALSGLTPMGIAVDPARNGAGAAERVISPPGARIAVCVIATDEQQAIADEARELLRGSGQAR
ncbi:acetate/propionate family kinase [Pilimelia columellifera]|uniref:Acetate kinase n=1 Tax=Pilimelia columellifera subsp. columellifera TaxID=706583 RepID=A0ABN3NNU9_9ACTN